MSNLDYCDARTRLKVEAILADPAVHNEVKRIIRVGLERDCLDAACDAERAANILDEVLDSIQQQPFRTTDADAPKGKS